ncbi:MAG: hypothetical protein PVF77_13375 [Anaerolineae bacterium]|jgi:hypothetical protein
MDDELRPAYDLSKLLKEGVRGKYADRYRQGTNLEKLVVKHGVTQVDLGSSLRDPSKRCTLAVEPPATEPPPADDPPPDAGH